MLWRELERRVVRVVGDRFDDPPDQAFDVAQELAFVDGAHRDRDTRGAGTPRSAHAVDVGLGNLGHVEVDHVRDVVHVEATCGDVAGHQDAGGAIAKA